MQFKGYNVTISNDLFAETGFHRDQQCKWTARLSHFYPENVIWCVLLDSILKCTQNAFTLEANTKTLIHSGFIMFVM